MIYLDNAATSWPKPPSVVEAMCRSLSEFAGNPGRTDHHAAFDAAEAILACRENIAALFHVADPLRICFAANTTAALNLAIKGLLGPDDHVICTSLEHNAVWRPLVRLQETGTQLSIIETTPEGEIEPGQIASQIRVNTRLIIATHASNVNGAILPVAEIGRLAHEHGALFLVDAAQSAGSVPINVDAIHCDLFAFPGHKGLLGPQGTGGLYVREGITLRPLLDGGTGSASTNPDMPEYLPDRYEAGTQNLPGIVGLNEGVKYVLHHLEEIQAHEQRLTQLLLSGLSELDRVKIYGPPMGEPRSSVVSFNIEGLDPVPVASKLTRNWDIACRSGLHCAYLAHRTQGTVDTGTIRLSPGPFTTEEEIHAAIKAVSLLARSC